MRILQNIIRYVAKKIEESNFILEMGRKLPGRCDESFSKYLRARFGFSLEALMLTAFVFSLFSGTITFLLLIKMGLSLAVVLSILTFYVTFIFIRNSVTSTYKYEKVILASLAPFIFYELTLNLEVSSVFEALQSISYSKYPLISRDFKKILNEIALGRKPEKQLLDYAFAQPSSDFKVAILTALTIDKKDINIEKYFQEAENEIEKIIKGSEIKILLTVITSTFFPILLTMVYIFWDYYWFIFTIPLVQLLFLVFLNKNYRMFILEEMVMKKDVLSELEECAEFLEAYGKFLELSFSPEKALTKTARVVSEKTKEKLRVMIKEVFFDMVPLRDAWSNLVSNFKHPYTVISLKIINKMMEKSSKDTGRKIIKIAAKLRERIVLERKKETLLSTQQLKAKVITMTSALLLGFITSIIPAVIYSSSFIFGATLNFSVNNLLIVISLLTATAIMAYTNCKATTDKNIKLHVALAVLIFLLTYNVNSLFLSIL